MAPARVFTLMRVSVAPVHGAADGGGRKSATLVRALLGDLLLAPKVAA